MPRASPGSRVTTHRAPATGLGWDTVRRRAGVAHRMPVESVFARLEPLLPAVQQADPVRRRRAQLGRPRTGTRRRLAGALGADVPGRVRGRPAQPGRADPLRGAQRAGRTCSPSAPTPCSPDMETVMREHRDPAVHRRRPPPGRRVRPARRLVRDRARLHQPAHRARPRRHPAARGRPHDDAPDRVAGGHAAFNPEPIADFVDAAVLGDGEEVVLAITEVVREWKAEGRPGGRDEAAACGWPRPAASTSRSSTTSTTCPTAASSASYPTVPVCRGGCTSTP